MLIKEQVISNFSRNVPTYDDHAHIQFAAANQLAENIKFASRQLVYGPVLEIGCGTGSLTIPLIETFGDREIVVSDLSPQMLEKCQQRVEQHFGSIPSKVRFQVLDGDHFEQIETFSTIVSSFALQWLADPQVALRAWLNSLKRLGKLFFSVPSDQSFPEWKSLCKQANVPFSGNPLPASALFTTLADSYNYPYYIYEEFFAHSYPSILDFLHDLKQLGASTSVRGSYLNVKQLSDLIQYSNNCNPDGFSITYDIIFGQIEKV